MLFLGTILLVISIITVNFGDYRRILALAESLVLFPPDLAWEWVILDNGSGNKVQDGLTKLKNEYNLPIKLILLQENKGFGAGNNEASQFAKGEQLFFVNPDVQVTKNTFTGLYKALQQQEVGFVCPKLITEDGNELENRRLFPNLWDLVWRRIQKRTIHKDLLVFWGQGAFLGVKKTDFKAIGGFDERFFLFLEDTDLCRRLCEHYGAFCGQFVPKSVAIHAKERLSGEGLAVFKPTFWIHVISAFKYAWKWRNKNSIV